MRNVALHFLSILTLSSCAIQPSHREVIHDEPMLIGTIDRNELFKEFPIFRTAYEAYTPNDSLIQAIKSYKEAVHIEIFLGTWCGDTKRNLPPFIKILERISSTNLTYTLHAVDRTKKDRERLTVKYSVSRVPTMIFLKNGKEIGRITEHPVYSLEQDLLSILQP